jgi:hypothetical protein
VRRAQRAVPRLGGRRRRPEKDTGEFCLNDRFSDPVGADAPQRYGLELIALFKRDKQGGTANFNLVPYWDGFLCIFVAFGCCIGDELRG